MPHLRARRCWPEFQGVICAPHKSHCDAAMLTYPDTPAPSAARTRTFGAFGALTLGSIGVVYGDIGTSPLYALREALNAAIGGSAVPPRAAVLGVLSLICWALIVIVTLKYVLVLLRADN